MCMHEGQPCPGRSCACECMNCMMENEETRFLISEARRFTKSHCKSRTLFGALTCYRDHYLKKEEPDEIDVIELVTDMLRK